MKKNIRISIISKLNYIKLIYRSILGISVLTYYILTRTGVLPPFDFTNPLGLIVLGIITLLFVGEMIERFIPSKTSSMGSQKQFAHNYRPSGEDKSKLQPWKGTFFVLISWIALNAIIGALYFLNVIDLGIIVIISLAFSVCDLICILFFCPFQTWMMHNRCCTTCRIYNWDFAMMFTPLIFIIVVPYGENGFLPNPFAIVLVATSLALVIKWEIIYRRHPERYSDQTNLSLRCENCKEKLCEHKKQLQKLIAKSRKLLQKRLLENKKKETK